MSLRLRRLLRLALPLACCCVCGCGGASTTATTNLNAAAASTSASVANSSTGAAPPPTQSALPTVQVTPTPTPPPVAPASRVVGTFTGTGDKTTTNFTVGGTWRLSWATRAETTPSVEVFDSSGTSLDHLDTGKAGNGVSYERQACTCYLKISVFGDTSYTFTVTDLPGGIPVASVPATFKGSSDQATASFSVSDTWTLSWNVEAQTTPTVEILDDQGNSVDHVDTGQAGAGSTVEHQSCTCYLKISVFGDTTYSFTVANGG